MELFKINGKINRKKLAFEILIPVVGGSIVGALANRNTKEKYKKLKTPSFAPPSWLFPVVWTGLYGMMGVAKYRIKQIAENNQWEKVGLVPYDIQLGLNLLWSFLFFKWGLRGTAFVEVSMLLAMITLTAYDFYKVDKTAGKLMVPYIGWVTYALGLNYAIWKMNRESVPCHTKCKVGED